MRMRDFIAAFGAAALAASPAMAAANPAAPLSVSSSVRASADNTDASQLAGGGGLLAVAILGAVIIAAIAIGDDGSDSP